MRLRNWPVRPMQADELALPDGLPFKDIDGRVLARAIVDTVREPLLVLDQDRRRRNAAAPKLGWP